jgi:hypothetical protein
MLQECQELQKKAVELKAVAPRFQHNDVPWGRRSVRTQ